MSQDTAIANEQLDAAPCSVKVELLYNGDYPGYACIRINDRWATEKEKAALVTIFGAKGTKHLYDMIGAERSHEEHKPWEGTLSFSQNTKLNNSQNLMSDCSKPTTLQNNGPRSHS